MCAQRPYCIHFQFDENINNSIFMLKGHAALTLRSRLKCIMVREDEDTDINLQLPIDTLVLNEIVIDRGSSSYLSNIDLFLDGKYITSVQGDGNFFFFWSHNVDYHHTRMNVL